MSEQTRTLLQKAMAPKSDQLNADDLVAGPRHITITHVRVSATGEQLVSIFYDGDNGKPWKPSKGMMRVLAGVYGDDPEVWVGKSITLYRRDDVRFGKDQTGGIRISHLSHIAKPLKITATVSRGKREQIDIGVFTGAVAVINKVLATPVQEDNPQRAWAKRIKAAAAYGEEGISEIWATVPEALKPELQDFYNTWLDAAKKIDADNKPPVQEEPPIPDEPESSNIEEF